MARRTALSIDPAAALRALDGVDVEFESGRLTRHHGPPRARARRAHALPGLDLPTSARLDVLKAVAQE